MIYLYFFEFSVDSVAALIGKVWWKTLIIFFFFVEFFFPRNFLNNLFSTPKLYINLRMMRLKADSTKLLMKN